MAAATIRLEVSSLRLVLLFAALIGTATARDAAAQTPVAAGFRDFTYGTTPTPSPSGERPQSKLWWNAGTWWGCLFSPSAARYRIHRLDPATHAWIDTGVDIDDRANSKADTLWEASTSKLYVASNYFSSSPAASSSPSRWGRLYRYSYLAAQDTYALDSGFPVAITRGSAEAMTIARDTAGRLWVTWVENKVVKINSSLSNDLDWKAPTDLPVGAAGSTSSDDISAVIAFGGGKIGVMWSNQNAKVTYFAVHRDVDLPTVWQPIEQVLPGCSGACSDDHINMKSDSTGRVFAVVKTSLTRVADPLIILAVRDTLGTWSNHTVGVNQDHHTRPTVLLAEDVSRVFVFATQPEAGGSIYYKDSPLDFLSFAPGLGTLFIDSASDATINNVTSTKGQVTQATGIVALATDANTRRYLHNELSLSGAAVTSFTPSSGGSGTQVTIGGYGLTGATQVKFNQSVATFSVISDQQIDASVPAGATTGPISVTTPAGIATSASNFVVAAPPSIQSFSPSSGTAGTSVLLTGSGFTGAAAVTFNGTAAAFTAQSDTAISTMVPAGAISGRIAVTSPGGTGTSATDFVVTGGGQAILKDITFENGNLLDPATGVDRVNGSVTLESGSPLSGAYSARISGTGDSYLEEVFSPVDDFVVTLYVRLDALPTPDVRILQLSNDGTTVGNILLRANGALRLRVGSTGIAPDSSPLAVGQVYRISLRQRRGSGTDAILEAFIALGDQAFSGPFAALYTGTWTTPANRVRVGATVPAALWMTLDSIQLVAESAPPPEPGVMPGRR